jgi:hypothetical protein
MEDVPRISKNILRGFIVYFVLVIVVSAVVSYLYSLFAHGQGVIDWGLSFQPAFIFGVALPIVDEFERKKK